MRPRGTRYPRRGGAAGGAAGEPGVGGKVHPGGLTGAVGEKRLAVGATSVATAGSRVAVGGGVALAALATGVGFRAAVGAAAVGAQAARSNVSPIKTAIGLTAPTPARFGKCTPLDHARETYGAALASERGA